MWLYLTPSSPPARLKPSALSACLVLALTLGPAQAQEPACERKLADLDPAWSSFAAWGSSPGEFHLVDALTSELLTISFDSPAPFEKRKDRTAAGKPSVLRTLPGDQYLLQDERDGTLVRLDASLAPIHREAVLKRPNERGEYIDALFNWVTDGQRILAIADVYTPSGWLSAAVVFPLERPEEFRVLHRLQTGDPVNALYRAGLPLAALIGDRAFFVHLRERQLMVTDLDSGTGGRPFPPHPRLDERLRFDLRLPEGSSQTVALYTAIAASIAPVGLLSTPKKDLFLLSRKPISPGETHWQATRLDPTAGTVLETFSLPTTAPHLVIQPGTPNWLIAEKGNVNGFAFQTIRSFLSIPESWFLRSDSPLIKSWRTACPRRPTLSRLIAARHN